MCPLKEGRMSDEDLTTVNIWDLAGMYRNPFGSASSLTPGGETLTVDVSQAMDLRAQARDELVRRGFDEDELAAVLNGDNAPLMRLIRGTGAPRRFPPGVDDR